MQEYFTKENNEIVDAFLSYIRI